MASAGSAMWPCYADDCHGDYGGDGDDVAFCLGCYVLTLNKVTMWQ